MSEGHVRRRARSPAPKKKQQTPSSTPSKVHHGKSEVEYEFGGPVGTLGTMLALPVVIMFLYFGASKSYKFNFTNWEDLAKQFPTSLEDYWSMKAFYVVCFWFLFQVFLERVLFFEKAQGVKLRTGDRLTYRISAHLQFWVSWLVLLYGKPVFNEKGEWVGMTSFPLAWIYDNYVQLASAAIVFSTLVSVYVYLGSFKKGALLAEGGDTGNPVYDFFIGRELNPRIGSFDIKEFCELRPGLIGWAVINAGCAAKQYQLLGKVTPSMMLINIAQGLYVWDGLYHEKAILTTMDITTDGFGFMLAFGDLAWVPFSYSLQARYLVENDPGLSASMLACIVALKCLGYFIFRGSNSEKDAFRRDPNSEEVAHLKTMSTKTGRKLLISGFFGAARKINYTGDWFMGISWSLTTGFGCVVTYFYPIYFFILLVHRAYRDDHACSKKYGDDWKAYKQHVPYIFIPGII